MANIYGKIEIVEADAPEFEAAWNAVIPNAGTGSFEEWFNAKLTEFAINVYEQGMLNLHGQPTLTPDIVKPTKGLI